MVIINKNYFLAVLFFVCFSCSTVCSQDANYKDPSLVSYVLSRHWDCDSFLVKYSPYKNLLGVLLINSGNNGYKLEVFNTHTNQKIFYFEPMTLSIADFRLSQDLVIVSFADVYGTQIAYNVYTAEIVWRT